MAGGRPRIDCDQHKDLILQLYQAKTPWAKIEQILLTEHGIKVKARTIIHRFKDWDTATNRVRTETTDELKEQIKMYWADKNNRPKTDDELQQKLTDDGFTVSVSAIRRLRNDMRLFRRWDHRLGRVRPEAELDKRRKNRRQKGAAFTDAQLAPLDPDLAVTLSKQRAVEAQAETAQPASSIVPSPTPVPVLVPGLRAKAPRRRRQAQPSQPQPPQPAQAAPTPPQLDPQPLSQMADPSSAIKDA